MLENRIDLNRGGGGGKSQRRLTKCRVSFISCKSHTLCYVRLQIYPPNKGIARLSLPRLVSNSERIKTLRQSKMTQQNHPLHTQKVQAKFTEKLSLLLTLMFCLL
jgi:hypothetical protein